MIFLFSLINISFTFFFFLFGRLIESVIFGIVSIVYMVYFSTILSFFVQKETNDHYTPNHDDHETSGPNISFGHIVRFLKKGSYYISFLLFYISLYGLVYGVGIIYGSVNFFDIFNYVTLGISVVITSVFFIFLGKKHETLFLVFRSNCMSFTFVYGCALLLFLIKGTQPTLFFLINAIFPLLTLTSVIYFDIFLGERSKYIYGSLLGYLVLIVIYFTTLLFPDTEFLPVFLFETIFFSTIYTFVFPIIRHFRRFILLSESIGIWMSYLVSLVIMARLAIWPLSFFYSSMTLLVILYQYQVYKYMKNYFSYIISLIIIMLFYTKLFISSFDSIFYSILFVFTLPGSFILCTYFVYRKHPLEVYILHYMAIGFSILSTLYYFIFVVRPTILLTSLFLFLESILIFSSYLRLKK